MDPASNIWREIVSIEAELAEPSMRADAQGEEDLGSKGCAATTARPGGRLSPHVRQHMASGRRNVIVDTDDARAVIGDGDVSIGCMTPVANARRMACKTATFA
jgi:hypothetical protein